MEDVEMMEGVTVRDDREQGGATVDGDADDREHDGEGRCNLMSGISSLAHAPDPPQRQGLGRIDLLAVRMRKSCRVEYA